VDSSEHLVPAGFSDPGQMFSYAVDMWFDGPELLTDARALLKVMRDAAISGHAVVLGESAHQFDNGAVTAVLVLSQSHLSVHTWPEHVGANFDVLTCGKLNGELMIAHLERELKPIRVNATCVVRNIA